MDRYANMNEPYKKGSNMYSARNRWEIDSLHIQNYAPKLRPSSSWAAYKRQQEELPINRAIRHHDHIVPANFKRYPSTPKNEFIQTSDGKYIKRPPSRSMSTPSLTVAPTPRQQALSHHRPFEPPSKNLFYYSIKDKMASPMDTVIAKPPSLREGPKQLGRPNNVKFTSTGYSVASLAHHPYMISYYDRTVGLRPGTVEHRGWRPG